MYSSFHLYKFKSWQFRIYLPSKWAVIHLKLIWSGSLLSLKIKEELFRLSTICTHHFIIVGEELLKAWRRDLWKFKWGSSVFWRKCERSQKYDSLRNVYYSHIEFLIQYSWFIYYSVVEGVRKNLCTAWLVCKNFSWYLSRVTTLTKDQRKERVSPLLWWTVAERKNKRWCLCNWKISVTHNR